MDYLNDLLDSSCLAYAFPYHDFLNISITMQMELTTIHSNNKLLLPVYFFEIVDHLFGLKRKLNQGNNRLLSLLLPSFLFR